jgi:RNA polymerase sigma-70 factor (ECF subfamily)
MTRRSPDVAQGDAVLAARAGHDPQALSLLYRAYLDPVYRYCYHRLGSREDAEDATSQVFTRMLSGLPTFRGERPFRSWLFAIAHNVVVDMYRLQRTTEPLDAAADAHDLAPSPEDFAVSVESGNSVLALLAQLTPDQARVMELRLAGLKEVEIADVLGRRPGAVRALQFRALTRLRNLLEGSVMEEGGSRG